MSSDPRVELQSLVSALQEHMMAALNKDDSDTTTLESAEDALVEAFENYEDALYNVTGEVTPLDIFEDDDIDDDDDDFDDDDYDEDDEDEDY
ncbi:hypothetical protein QDX25_02880 [Auritidibacter ignavus]|uniref:hypothetical protein n=1 Tax=Auritidibacter TaxID=1160973 RepID=UPI000D73113E|nr:MULTISPECIES: hypothetical protein [Auritidibacter]PXA77802.1 hypothetical protein DCC24_02515 [Auritidibacter sp. NML100628]PXA81535.1 hypothetical protein DCC25_03065 [Auritidibacter sp. NML120636]WGH82124.1 hypothetical protein QDX25_02880 [Auritidibacter ignavus]WGH91318.1 hypothetical protein QDX23_02825 [Auritidibacter ignavus]WHS27934.1 hypothetical protein QM395_11315 [Auritidibacter ignavus]